MRKVYKYEIQTDGLTVDAAIISPLYVAAVDDKLFLWAEVEIGGVPREHRFFAYPTGHMAIPEYATYVGTALMHDGALVWHVYELKEDSGR